MTEAPETIWAEVLSPRQSMKLGSTGVWDDFKCSDSTAYIRGDIHDASLARIAALEAEVARLRAALEPFAAFADLIDDQTEGFGPDDVFKVVYQEDGFDQHEMQRFPLSDFLSARAALAGGE